MFIINFLSNFTDKNYICKPMKGYSQKDVLFMCMCVREKERTLRVYAKDCLSVYEKRECDALFKFLVYNFLYHHIYYTQMTTYAVCTKNIYLEITYNRPIFKQTHTDRHPCICVYVDVNYITTSAYRIRMQQSYHLRSRLRLHLRCVMS